MVLVQDEPSARREPELTLRVLAPDGVAEVRQGAAERSVALGSERLVAGLGYGAVPAVAAFAVVLRAAVAAVALAAADRAAVVPGEVAALRAVADRVVAGQRAAPLPAAVAAAVDPWAVGPEVVVALEARVAPAALERAAGLAAAAAVGVGR